MYKDGRKPAADLNLDDCIVHLTQRGGRVPPYCNISSKFGKKMLDWCELRIQVLLREVGCRVQGMDE